MRTMLCFWNKKRVMPPNSITLSELRNQNKTGVRRTENAREYLEFQIPLENIIKETYRIKSDTNDDALNGSSIFTNQLRIIFKNGKKDNSDEYEKQLIEYTLAFMAIGLDSEYAGNKPNSKSRYYPAAGFIDEWRYELKEKEQSMPILDCIDAIMRRDLQNVEDKYLKMSPYHFLRAAIYIEIQRIEERSLDSGRFARAQKIRDAMHELDNLCTEPNIEPYEKLKKALSEKREYHFSSLLKSLKSKTTSSSASKLGATESLLENSGSKEGDVDLKISLKEAFEALPYSYAFGRMTSMVDRIDAALTPRNEYVL